jgi:DNA-binding FadR family transcriptional regulator
VTGTRKTIDRVSAAASRRGGARALKSDNVIDLLGGRIVAGRFDAGQRLPREADLCRQLGVSRPSLREGLKALVRKGLVESRTRRGTTVLAKTSWDLLDSDVLGWMTAAPPDPAFLIDLLEVRTIVEPAAAARAAQRASPAQIVRIEQAYRGMEAALPHDVEACCRHDLDFHESIIAAAGNVLLSRLAAAIRMALLSAFRVSANARDSYAASLDEHWAVAVAIRRRAPADAERAMRALLAGTARDLAPAFRPPPADATPRQSAPRQSAPRQSAPRQSARANARN